jgi:hypothetical protein
MVTVSTELLLSRQAGFKFQIPSGISGTPGPPTCLILQYLAISFGGKLKVKYTEHILQMLMT